MKKIIFLSFLLICSNVYSVSFKDIIWMLIKPINSVDSEAQNKIRLWHDKKENGQYFWPDESLTNDGYRMGYLRNLYPEASSEAVKRLAKNLILLKNNRMVRMGMIAKGHSGLPDEMEYVLCPPEQVWEQQPLIDRILWSIRYRRPYTYGLTLAKWTAEVAVVAGVVYGAYKLKKRYDERKKAKKAQEANEKSNSTISVNPADNSAVGSNIA